MKIFDSQVHVERGMDQYDLEVAGRNLIFNSLESYRENRERCAGKTDAVTIILEFRKELAFVRREIEAGRASALKIHSRVQRIPEHEYPAIAEALNGFPSSVPVVIDAFYFGSELEFQPSLPGIIHLIKSQPARKFVVAHCGGHRVLDYFFHLRPLENFYYDLSFSLQYLEDSSHWVDLVKLVRHTDKSRLLFGTDYPDASPSRQSKNLHAILSTIGASPADRAAIFHDNAEALFRTGARGRG